MEHPAREGRGGVAAIRRDFPLLHERYAPRRARVRGYESADDGKPLVYLEQCRDDAEAEGGDRSAVALLRGRRRQRAAGVYALSEHATDEYERARITVQRFLNAALPREIVFVRGTTEAINLVSAAWGRAHLDAGDEVVVSEMEHHSNIVPWQIACEERRASLRVIPIDDAGDLRLDQYERLLTAFAGVRLFPVRAKCALLAWRMLAAALDASEDPVSTE